MVITSRMESCKLRDILDKTLNILGDDGKKNLFRELEESGIIMDEKACCSFEKIRVVFRQIFGAELANILLERVAAQLQTR